MQGAHTALFVGRVARGTSGTDWHLSTIGEVDHTARDFGSLGARARARTHARTASRCHRGGGGVRDGVGYAGDGCSMPASRVPPSPRPFAAQHAIMRHTASTHPAPP